MATKFMSGTELFMYECMMQQTPNMARCEREEKRFKAQYIGLLRDYMREYGYGEISKRVINVTVAEIVISAKESCRSLVISIKTIIDFSSPSLK